MTELSGPTLDSRRIGCFSSRGRGGVGSRVELVEAIRQDADRGGLSIRALSEKYEVHRRKVRQALAGATPPPRKKRTFPAPHGNIIETGTVSYRLAHARAQRASR